MIDLQYSSKSFLQCVGPEGVKKLDEVRRLVPLDYKLVGRALERREACGADNQLETTRAARITQQYCAETLMDIDNVHPSIVTAGAVVLGSLVGALASLASTWSTLKYQGRRDNLARQITRREALYSSFVNEAARMYSDALVRTLENPQSMATLWGLLACIRLGGSDAVLVAAEKVANAIIEQYRAPSLNVDDIRDLFLMNGDPLKEFSLACRKELDEMDRVR